MKRNIHLGGPIALALAAVLSTFAAQPADAQTPPAASAPAPAAPAQSLTGFQPFSDFELKVDSVGAPKAEIYRSTRAGAYLVIDPKFEFPLMLQVSRRSVETINPMKVTRRTDGSIDLLPGASIATLGEFKMQDGDAIWTALGHSARLTPRPWLLKNQSGATLLSHDTAYERRAASYQLDPAVLDELKGQTKNAKVLVFFGSWCPHCQQNVPKLLQLERTLAGAGHIRFDYYGLPNGAGFSTDPEAKKFGISTVPTGVVLVDGVEVGRFDGASWTKIEAALRDLLKGSQSKKPA
jgi:thiol-disulfide isomerase/thioredoxin